MTEVLILGLTIFFASTLLRAFPWPTWALSRKPLACPTCLAGWGGIASFLVMMERAEWSTDWWAITLLCSSAAGVAVLAESLKDYTRGSSWPPPPGGA